MDMKKTMNGNDKCSVVSISIGALALGAIIYFQTKSLNKLKLNTSDISIQQYLNRLTEFFNENELPNVKKEFLGMIEFGMYPKNAFKILTFDGELN